MALTLEIQGDSGNFTFDVQGEFLPRMIPEFTDNTNPPEVTSIRTVWEFRQALIRSSDGTVETLWDEWLAFLARLRTRGSSYPTYAKVVRAGVDEWTLGPSTYEDFRIEVVEGETWEDFPGATWQMVVPVTLLISGVEKFADPTTGIVNFDQEVTYSHDNGLTRIRWETQIETKEGTDAVAKAKTYGLIPIANLGETYSFVTNGDDGIDWLILDADETNSRTPTLVRATCVVQQFGVSVGTTSAGTSPSRVSWMIKDTVEKRQQVRTYEATAEGPGAMAWCLLQGTNNSLGQPTEKEEEFAQRFARCMWEVRSEADSEKFSLIKVEVSGGKKRITFEEVDGGFAPLKFVGAVMPTQVVVNLEVRNTGDPGALDFPGILPEPYVLIPQSTTETEAYREPTQVGRDDQVDVWMRTATIVYLAPAAYDPEQRILDLIKDQPRVKSYVG